VSDGGRTVTTAWARFRAWRWWWQALVWVLVPPLPVALWAASQPHGGRRLAWGLVALVAAAWLSVGWAAGARHDPATGTAAPPTVMPDPPTTAAAPGGSALVDRLVLAPESPDAGYERGLFPHWHDADGDGCDTRCEVLATERRTYLSGLAGGGWLSLYDGATTPDAGDLDIDHVVALAEAWRSRAAGWDAARREAFANDLAAPGELVAVTAAVNRAKGDRDPASWRPPDRGAWCAFAISWATTKVRWGLSADPAEVAALRGMLAGC
jgi:hypothetical protein